MPIDSSIAMGVKPVQLESPMNMMAQAMQIKGAMNQNDLAQYSLAKAQRTDSDMNALMQHLQSGGDLSTPEGQAAAIRVAPLSALPMIKAQIENTALTAKGAKDNSEAVNRTIANYRDNSQAITDPTSAAAFVTAMHSDPALKGTAISRIPLDQALAQIPQDPSQLPAWKQQFALGATKFMEMNKPEIVQERLGGTNKVSTIAPMTGTVNPISNNAITVSPDAVLSSNTSIQTTGMNNATSIRNTNANIGKDYRVSGLNPDGTDPNGNVGGLSPEAVDNAARRYNFDGTLPPNMGRGTQGALETKRILTRAAALANVSPDDASGGRAGQMANKADASALARLTQQQQLASSFERTANANADLALRLSKQMDRSGIPLINAGIQAWRTGTGSPEATQFAAANETFVNEYAKIMSGGMGNGPVTDSARSKAHTLLSTAMTPEQYAGNVKLLQTEMQNRMKGYGDQADEIRSRLRGVATPAPGGGAAGATPGGAPSGWGIQRVN